MRQRRTVEQAVGKRPLLADGALAGRGLRGSAAPSARAGARGRVRAARRRCRTRQAARRACARRARQAPAAGRRPRGCRGKARCPRRWQARERGVRCPGSARVRRKASRRPTSWSSRSSAARTARSSSSDANAVTRSVRQRERMVTGMRPSAVATRRNSVRGGGSSSAFSNALAAFWLRSSARSTTTTRHPDLACAMAEEVAQAAHLVDADILRVALRLVVPRAADQKQVRVTETRNFTEHGVIGIDRSVRRPLLSPRASTSRARR